MRRALCLVLACLTLLPGCTAVHPPRDADGERLIVVASLFPQYDFAKIVGGERVSVSMLLPPGTESHTFDPKPADIAGIYGADLFIYTGQEMEPWAARLLDGAPDTLSVVDASLGIEALREEAHDGHAHDGGSEEEHAYDPHIWLDPTLAMVMVGNIADSLCAADPDGRDYYLQNAEQYKEKLSELDEEFAAAAAGRKTDGLVFGGRFAYLYFLTRYGIPYKTAYDTCSTQSEPSLKRMAELTAYIKEYGIPCVYHEEIAEHRVADALCEATGARCLLFSTAHNVTKKQFDDGITYLDVMYQNLENLKTGLGL